MIFDIPVSELWLNNEDFDGYNTIEYEIDDDEIEKEILNLISEEYSKETIDFIKEWDIFEWGNTLENMKEYYIYELTEYAKEKYKSEN